MQSIDCHSKSPIAFPIGFRYRRLDVGDSIASGLDMIILSVCRYEDIIQVHEAESGLPVLVNFPVAVAESGVGRNLNEILELESHFDGVHLDFKTESKIGRRLIHLVG